MNQFYGVTMLALTCACSASPPAASGPGNNGAGNGNGGTSGVSVPSASLKHLRTWEYQNSVMDLLGQQVTESFPADLVRANFSSVSATLDCHSDATIELFESSAFSIVDDSFAAATPGQSAACRNRRTTAASKTSSPRSVVELGGGLSAQLRSPSTPPWSAP